MNDRFIIYAAVESAKEELEPHFIYCGWYYQNRIQKFQIMFLTKMKRYGIKSCKVIMVWMYRLNVITKEKAKQASKGKLENDADWRAEKNSVNDDLENFFNNLQNSKERKIEGITSFFTPKLTKKELKLVELKKEDHLSTYSYHYVGQNHDVSPDEMEKSDSKSKYVLVRCNRVSFRLTLELK